MGYHPDMIAFHWDIVGFHWDIMDHTLIDMMVCIYVYEMKICIRCNRDNMGYIGFSDMPKEAMVF